jgi:hypothetical protein
MLERYSKLLNIVFKVWNFVSVANLKTLNYFNEPYISANYIENSIIEKFLIKTSAWKTFENDWFNDINE